MPRTVKEWVGRNDDSMPPKSVFDRLYDKQDGKDAITGIKFRPGDKIHRDHITPLKDGGENRESNLQLITEKQHKLKTAREAHDRATVRHKAHKHRAYVTGRPKQKIPSRGFKRPPSNTVDINADRTEAPE